LSINQKTSQFHDNGYHDPQGDTHAKGPHQINPFAALILSSFNFYIDRFQIRIDRVSVSQHETALLIS